MTLFGNRLFADELVKYLEMNSLLIQDRIALKIQWKNKEKKSISSVRLFEIPWTIAHKALLSMNSPGQNTEVGSHSHLQGIFLIQGLNPNLLLCRQILYHLSHQVSPKKCILIRSEVDTEIQVRRPCEVWTKKYIHNLNWRVILFEGYVQNSKPERQHLSSSEKTAPRRLEQKSGYIKV